MKLSFILLALGWSFGTAIGLALPLGGVFAACIGVASAAVLLVHFRRFALRSTLYIAAAVFISVGYASVTDQLNGSRMDPYVEQEQGGAGVPLRVEGRIVSAIEIDGDKAIFVVKAGMIRINGAQPLRLKERFHVQLKLQTQEQQSELGEWRRGDRLRLEGTARRPDISRNYGGFDYREYMRDRRIHWILYVKDVEGMEVFRPEGISGSVLMGAVDRLRDGLSKRIDRFFPHEQAGFMKSLLIGVREDQDPAQFRQFSSIGLSHIMAISGLHVAVVLGALAAALRWLRIARETNMTISMAFVPLFVMLTGAAPSVVRAGIMALIALYAMRRNLLKDGLNVLGAAGFLMLLWNPYYLRDVSFQLSFLVTLGLIWGVPRIGKLMPIRSKWMNGMFSVMLTAQLASFPLTVYYFNQYSLISWIANLLFVPLISLVVLPLGYLTLAFSFFHPKLAMIPAYIIDPLNKFCFIWIERLDRLEIFRLSWPSPSLLWIAIYYAVLGFILQRLYRFAVLTRDYGGVPMFPERIGKERLHAWIPSFVACSLLVFLLAYGYSPHRFDRFGTVSFIDVGQGDSILITTPEKRTILIDGGGTFHFRKPGEEWKARRDPFEIGNKQLVPLLKKRGVHRLDLVVISHEDMDHIGGLQAVLEQIPVKSLVFNGTLRQNEQVERLFAEALSRNVNLYAAKNGMRLALDRHTEMRFLWPIQEQSTPLQIENEQNNYSLVCLMKMYESRFLFTGDISAKTESEWLQRFSAGGGAIDGNRFLYDVDDVDVDVDVDDGGGGMAIDVLKVAHHGSKASTSQAWLDYWKPMVAVISVGRYNSYGHPSPLVLNRLIERGVKVRRTDMHGEIQFQVLPGQIKMRHKLGEEPAPPVVSTALQGAIPPFLLPLYSSVNRAFQSQ